MEKIVNKTKLNCTFNFGKINEAQKLFGQFSNADNVIAYLNNQAIAFSKNKDYTLQAIANENKKYQLIMNYYLSLTFAGASFLKDRIINAKVKGKRLNSISIVLR